MLLLIANELKAKEAISFEDGEELFQLMSSSIKSKVYTDVDFSEITFSTSPFLYAAFGQLHEAFATDVINKYIHIININDGTKLIYDEVLSKSRDYGSDPEFFTQTANSIIYGI